MKQEAESDPPLADAHDVGVDIDALAYAYERVTPGKAGSALAEVDRVVYETILIGYVGATARFVERLATSDQRHVRELALDGVRRALALNEDCERALGRLEKDEDLSIASTARDLRHAIDTRPLVSGDVE